MIGFIWRGTGYAVLWGKLRKARGERFFKNDTAGNAVAFEIRIGKLAFFIGFDWVVED